MKWRGVFVCFLIGLLGCDEGPYPGFKELGPGLWFRLNALGEGHTPGAVQDRLYLRLRAARLGAAPGSLFSTERTYTPSDLRVAGLGDVLDRCLLGDSVSVIANASAIVWERLAPEVGAVFPDTGTVAIEIRFLEDGMWTPRANGGLSVEQEGRLLDSLAAADAQWVRWGTSRLHYQVLGAGTDTLPIGRGQGVTITYSGSLPDGRIIDGLRERGGELTFVFGDPDQVIEGLEVAVSLLHEGGRGRFLIPSELGFGPQGSGGGLVPPNTPLIYEVEVLQVDRGPHGPS